MASYRPLMPSPLDPTLTAAGMGGSQASCPHLEGPSQVVCFWLGWLLRPHQSQEVARTALQHSSASPDNALITCPVTPPIRPSSPPGPGLIRQPLHTAQRDTDKLISAHSGC